MAFNDGVLVRLWLQWNECSLTLDFLLDTICTTVFSLLSLNTYVEFTVVPDRPQAPQSSGNSNFLSLFAFIKMNALLFCPIGMFLATVVSSHAVTALYASSTVMNLLCGRDWTVLESSTSVSGFGKHSLSSSSRME